MRLVYNLKKGPKLVSTGPKAAAPQTFHVRCLAVQMLQKSLSTGSERKQTSPEQSPRRLEIPTGPYIAQDSGLKKRGGLACSASHVNLDLEAYLQD